MRVRPRKVLLLEQRQGCRDQAVIGGLPKFLSTWAAQMAQGKDAGAAAWALDLAERFQRYSDLSPDERKGLVAAALAEMDRGVAAAEPLRWDDPVTELGSVGPQRAQLLRALGIETLGDLLCYYPHAYEDRRETVPLAAAQHRQPILTRVVVTGPGMVQYAGNMRKALVPARDRTGECRLAWVNQPYMARQYARGETLLIKGQARRYPSGLEILVQKAERLPAGPEEEQGLTPLYATTEGISEQRLRELIEQALDRVAEIPSGLIPPELAKARGLQPLAEAIRQAHRPDNLAAAQAAQARLAYESLFAMQASLARRRERHRRSARESRIPVAGVAERWAQGLPFRLTQAQERAIREILADLEAEYPGQRLLHGEVGSGKTVVAGAALLATALAGRQAALMAPTELLAEQHWRVLTQLLQPWAIPVQRLTAGAAPAEATRVREALASGEALVTVGTHALFQGAVRFADLALVVVDEQHRFGVKQRARLAAKGLRPNLLVMSATPIPRTLALTAYGDFDVSVLDEQPPGRQPVFTQVLTAKQRWSVNQALVDHAVRGQRSFIVCPVIGEGKNEFLAPAEETYERLRRSLPSVRFGLVHGRLPAQEREEIMERFRRGELDALVATSVIEVGVDVPEATLMVVENAERFGLAQLHQLRGRVARAAQPARCFLLTNSRNPEVLDRLQVLERTADGFEIAQQDLLRRGPGELFGAKQHGYLDVRLAQAASDTRLLVQAREDAQATLEVDADLQRPEHQALRRYLERHEALAEPWTL